jgi:hypothetical protein
VASFSASSLIWAAVQKLVNLRYQFLQLAYLPIHQFPLGIDVARSEPLGGQTFSLILVANVEFDRTRPNS